MVAVSPGILAALAPFVLPASSLSRLGALFGVQHVEADESSRSREYLLKKSLEYTAQFPLFGVGPDQFSNFEGKQRVDAGLVGNWHATHCAWTQVSAECGIPAFLLFAGGIGTAFVGVWKTHKKAKKRGFTDIQKTTFCYLTGMIAYLVAITFLAHAYNHYLPTMIGLAISMTITANRIMDQQAKTVPVPRLAAW